MSVVTLPPVPNVASNACGGVADERKVVACGSVGLTKDNDFAVCIYRHRIDDVGIGGDNEWLLVMNRRSACWDSQPLRRPIVTSMILPSDVGFALAMSLWR